MCQSPVATPAGPFICPSATSSAAVVLLQPVIMVHIEVCSDQILHRRSQKVAGTYTEAIPFAASARMLPKLVFILYGFRLVAGAHCAE